MDLKKIRTDNEGYVNAQDIMSFFPKRKLESWLKGDVRNVKMLEDYGIKPMKRISGRYGGTYLHPHLALDLCRRLSFKFMLLADVETMKGIENGII
ncbi:MAG: KilA-N domain-containing protein [Planctomycetes bacterium]|nr:KilA-N domain-containing protein [Planctomycetota bacterium]